MVANPTNVGKLKKKGRNLSLLTADIDTCAYSNIFRTLGKKLKRLQNIHEDNLSSRRTNQ